MSEFPMKRTLYLFKNAQKGEGAKKIKVASRLLIDHYKSSNLPGFRVSPSPYYIKLWKRITPFSKDLSLL